MVRELYQLTFYCNNMKSIDCDLNSVNVSRLCELGVPFNTNNAHCDVTINESDTKI